MKSSPSNIILIGMPAAGKSTIGVLLAKALAMQFVDTDLLVQARAGRSLQELLDEMGLERFCALEADTVLSIRATRTVIATGGSVVYGEDAMTHLQSLGRIVYLDVPLAEIQRRLTNLASRGVVLEPGQSVAQLYAARQPLYRRYATLTVDASADSHQIVVDRLLDQLDSAPH